MYYIRNSISPQKLLLRFKEIYVTWNAHNNAVKCMCTEYIIPAAANNEHRRVIWTGFFNIFKSFVSWRSKAHKKEIKLQYPLILYSFNNIQVLKKTYFTFSPLSTSQLITFLHTIATPFRYKILNNILPFLNICSVQFIGNRESIQQNLPSYKPQNNLLSLFL